ncbi:MAG: hypothetical protein ABS81_07265 [Pseudonocardia sp. SCN 72-86]|nr:MAG: hypothetical protein ABS81_07265 [Pseudonocardia sp. SCN 72-86]
MLSGLSDRFDTLAQELAEVYPGVGEFWTVSDAAQADEDGSTVVRWNAAAKIAVALDRLTDLVLGLAHPKSQTGSTKPRSSINHARILTLHADPSTFDQAAYHRAIDGKSFRGGVFDTKRTPTGQAYPFGIYGLALDAGAVLSLPKSSADWSARADEFTRAQAFVDDSDDRDDDDL